MNARIDTGREFVALTKPHLARLHRVGMQLTHQPDETEDLVQETLTKAWANWHRFDRAGSLGAWLVRILVNTFISRHRHQRVVDATAARADIRDHLYGPARVSAADQPEERWHQTSISDEIQDALRGLPRHYREIVTLVDVRGLEYKEAADELGVPIGTVMSRLHRGRHALREMLTDAKDGGQ